ncbi:GAF and ANTAR domain-containing protein [Amycolatopsis anabasis]|uniref:GAF and ANTAR domain-containing protein n=1 Tax=Amycolatopsis anabasis TaxID=1840409 RepID=UPI00131AF59C|nr:GAF and ANTAR domain-containing protein [Amycolatopsis anabasis]
MDNREAWLAETVVELADLQFGNQDPADSFGQLVRRYTELLAPAEVSLLTGDEQGELRPRAATTEQTHALALLQLGHREGPCVDVYRSGGKILNQHLDEADARWPVFTPVAVAAGFQVVHALPLRHRATMIGVVGVFGRDARMLPESEAGLAQTLADLVAIGVLQQRAIRQHTTRSDQLQQALVSRVVIEQAKGAVAARLGIGVDRAFNLLREHARRHGRRLHEVAGEAVRGALPMTALLAGRTVIPGNSPPSAEPRPRSGRPAENRRLNT